GQTNLPAGTYYLGVVSEGVNSQPETEIGSNATTYVVQSLGSLSVSNLGTVGTTDLQTTNALLEGGNVAAYQFTVPPNTLGMELRFEGVVGNPLLSLVAGTQLPSAYTPYGEIYNSTEGGQGYNWESGDLVILPNPVPGTYSLLVNASATGNGLVPDDTYGVRISQLTTPNLNISSLLNTNGGTNVAAGTLAATESAFFEVNVPSSINGAPVLGWNLALSESSGSPSVRVRQNLLPANTCDTTAFASGSIVVAPPYLTPGTWYVEVNSAIGSASFTLTSSVITTNTTTRSPWVMPAIGQTNTAPGLFVPEFGDTGVDTNGVALPGDQGVDLAQGQYDFYAIMVPTNNAGLLRTELQAISGTPYLFIRVGAVPTKDHHASGSCDNTSLIDEQLTGSGTEYGNWVPLDGKLATNLPPGLSMLSVYAAGDANARYRLQLSCGNDTTNSQMQNTQQGGMSAACSNAMANASISTLVQDLPLDGSIIYSNQDLAGGDWRYYRLQIPTNAPNYLVVDWTASQGSPHLFVRDTVPPGDGSSVSQNYNLYPNLAISWSADQKDQGPYPDFALPGSDALTTPPLRPGSIYYLGFWSPDDAAFSVTCYTNGGYINITNVVSLFGGLVGGSVPPHGIMQYRIDVPANAAAIVFNAGNSSNLVLSLEQGTVALPNGPADWVSSSTVSNLDQPLTGVWPWLPGYSYYLTLTNTSGTAGTFNLTAPDLVAASLASDATAASASSMKVWFSVTNAGNGTAISPYGYWMDQVTLSANGTLAGAIASWSWNFDGPLAPGASYTLTNTITLPSLPAGTYYLLLQTDAGNYVPENDKANNTSAAVGFTVGSAQPTIVGIHLSGNNLVLSGVSGLTGGTCYVLMGTNLALPLSQWTPVATNVLSGGGDFNITATNAVNPNAPRQFFILKLP
ncbi:MAG: CARDB domain-containing protein, partial [Verrucomicrobiia bacterium]